MKFGLLGIRRRRLLAWLPQTARPQVTGPRATGTTYASRMLPASRTARQARCAGTAGTVTGNIDLRTSNGRAMARVLVAMANKSREDTARRVARARLQVAQERRGSRFTGYR
jgi:DNA invertase Pin-like site-specific DNA recombinase